MKSSKIESKRFPDSEKFFNGKLLLTSVFISVLSFMMTNCAPREKSSADSIRTEVAATNQNTYVIEREIPGAGNLSPDELKEISKKSNSVLAEMDSDVKWLHSYVTGDKIYCVYSAPNEDLVREHAKKGGFPADAVSKVSMVIDPSTGN